MDLISTVTSQAVNKALDGYSARQKVIASNLANVETPNYQRRDVQFEGSLASAIRRQHGENASRQASNDEKIAMTATQSQHFALDQTASRIDDVTPTVSQIKGKGFKNDGNGVDLETESAQLARTTERYVALSNIESRRMRTLKSVITSDA